MKRKFYCANCGAEIENGVYMLQDNYLIVKFFSDYKSNRFCDSECACEFLMGNYIFDEEEIPLDPDEECEDGEEWLDTEEEE